VGAQAEAQGRRRLVHRVAGTGRIFWSSSSM
jgi:hypothetical protein